MTETSPLLTFSRPPHGTPDDQATRWTTRSGRLVPGVRARVVDESGTELPWDGKTVGEIELSGPTVTGSYFRATAEEQADKFRDGRLRSGDFPVTLAMGGSQVTLVINARDLYVVGWRNDATDTHWRLNTGPRTYGGAHPRNLDWANYNDMERAAGVSRDSLGISMGAIQGAISDLGNHNSTTAGRNEARSLLILTQAIT